jgi:hypothetical protein
MIDRSFTLLKLLVRAVARSRVALIGAQVSGMVLPVLLICLFLDMHGVVKNPYFGFLIYMVMGPLFVAGLVSMVTGLFLFKDKEEIGVYALEYLKEQISMPGRLSRVRKLIYISSFLTFLTLTVIVVVAYYGFTYTESVRFCGMFCHTVMEPEYITYQNSPHSRVPCVDCHISSSAGVITKSKISGIRMIFATLFNRYDRPIPTPISSLRPTREVCEKCHRPEKFHGDKLYVKESFRPDRENTMVQTVLLMKIGSGGYREQMAQGIHWHVSPRHLVYYQEDPRQPDRIDRIKLIDHDGAVSIYQRGGKAPGPDEAYRLLDCLGCHNRPTHIFLSPDEALDNKLATGVIPVDLPYVKKLALELLQRDFAGKEQARRQIDTAVNEWYGENYPALAAAAPKKVAKAARGIYQAWSENVFPEMNITWRTYDNKLGHSSERGCFRCHNKELVSLEGRVISSNCNLCHAVLADREISPAIMKILQGGEESPARLEE